ncbi:MAG: hypothetical protein MUC92_06450 [Fimbriimonadaceae bacterium]|jgi:hypothetical protein|nr:hypothetical protein [Fimbriimonadaceae bacterium]
MTGSLAALLFLTQFHLSFQPSQPPENETDPYLILQGNFIGTETGVLSVQVVQNEQPRDPAHMCPKFSWEFRFLTFGNVRLDKDVDTRNTRFRVFSQFRRGNPLEDEGRQAAQMLTRLWEFNRYRLNLDHRSDTYGRFVDVYLAFGGKAGGEQLLIHNKNEQVDGKPVFTNTFYIYDIASFVKPVERAREVAHEYGHASLPAIGPFDQPESWANGDIGERIFLRWIMEEMEKKKLTTLDTMGASLDDLKGYVKEKVTPQIHEIGRNGPNAKLLEGKSKASFDHAVSLFVYAQQILPQSALSRLMRLSNQDARQIPKTIVDVAAELRTWSPVWPTELVNQPLWLPLGKGTVRGGSVVRRQGDWALVSRTGVVTITNPPVSD